MDLQLSVGIQVAITKMTLNHSCFLSISKLDILLQPVMEMQFIVIQDMVQHSETVMISVYMKTQIKTIAVMLVRTMLTICQLPQVKKIQY